MKQSEQNEIDLLLRTFAGPSGGASSRASREGFDRTPVSEHLDADEMNAYAEGMLPERARARYSDHLADCANCRTVVVNLSRAAGVVTQRTNVDERSTKTFWDKLAAVFAQPVLRYALPAIVLASIVGIGLLALRQGEPEFIAQHQPSGEQPNINDSKQAVTSESPAPIGTLSNDASATSTPNASVPVEGPKGETVNTNAARTDATVPKSRAEAEAKPVEAIPTFAPDLNEPAAPPPMPAYTARGRVETLSKEDSLKREAQQAQAEEDKLQARDTDTSYRSAAPKAAGSPSTGSVQGLMTEQRGYGVKNKKDSAVDDETRTVSGKRFIRRDGAWVDSAYSASTATTNVKRGSEQYRALVADEPGIRNFADQLGGELIVVWKGRAYRIR
jgi:hypothetical protein